MPIKACLLFSGLLFVAHGAQAAPCAQVKAQPDAWVAAKVDALVQAARNAFEEDRALQAYEKVLDGIAGTIRECNLSDDQNFLSRYRNFLEFIDTAGLERRSDHELGFLAVFINFPYYILSA